MYGSSADVLFAVTSVEDKRSEFAVYGSDARAFSKLDGGHILHFIFYILDFRFVIRIAYILYPYGRN